MAQTFKGILGAIIGSLITIIFGWITIRTTVLNGKADTTYVDKRDTYLEEKITDEIEKRETEKLQMLNFLQEIENTNREEREKYQELNREERSKIEQRYIREIELTRRAQDDIKDNIKDIKTDLRFMKNNK